MIIFSRNDGLAKLSPAHRYYAYCIASAAIELPISGIYYHDKILSAHEIYDLAEIPASYRKNLIQSLIVCGWMGRIGMVYYLKDLPKFVAKPNIRYVMTQVKKLMGEINEDEAQLLGLEIDDTSGTVKQIVSLYGGFDQIEQENLKAYIACFRTQNQIENHVHLSQMSPNRHLNLLSEVVQIYNEGKFHYGNKEYSINRDDFFIRLRLVLARNLKALTNHNYLKKVLMNQDGLQTKRNCNVEGF